MTSDEDKSWNRNELGSELRMVREAQGRNLRSVAADVGLSPSHLAKLERGEWKRRPATDLLIKLAGTLDLDATTLAELAGLEFVVRRPEQWPSAEDQFSRLMLDEHFGPSGWKPAFLEHVPPLHRRLIVKLAVTAFQRGVEFGTKGYGRRIEEVVGVAYAELAARQGAPKGQGAPER
jgi:transcriptional regulator with XRE-family HTH domain